MFDSQDQSSPRRQRSLLALGDALRAEEPEGASRLARAVADARARREQLAADFRRARAQRSAGQLAFKDEPDPRSADTTPASDVEPLEEPQGHAEELPEAASADPNVPAAPVVEAQVEHTDTPDGGERSDDNRDDSRWEPLIDPVRVFYGIINSRKIIAASTVAGALLGVLIALNTPKTYYSAAELLADPRDLRLVERNLTEGGMSNEATLAIVDNQVRILKSSTVLSTVATRLNLAADPEFNGTGATGLGSYIPNIRSLFSSSDGADDPSRRGALAVMKLAKILTVERGGRTFVIVIGATTEDPDKSALIANTTATVFLERYGEIQSDSAGRAAGELTGKLDDLRTSLEAAERKVEAFKAENDLVDAQGRLITDDEIIKLNDQLGAARARTLELKARADSSRGVSADAVIGGSLPEELASATIQGLRTQYSTQKAEADRLSVRLGPRHPQLQAVEAQLEGLRAQIEAEVRRIAVSTQTEMRRAVELEQQLSSRLAQLKVRQGDVSSEMVTLRELEREATAKRAVYEAYLLRAKETGEQQGINSANISVISEASPPFESSSTSRSVIAMTGTALGFLFGIGIGAARGSWAGLRDTLRRRRSRGRAAPPVKPVATMFDRTPPAPADLSPDVAANEMPVRETPVEQPVPISVEAEPAIAEPSAQTRQDTMHRPHHDDYPPFEQPRPAPSHPQASHPYPQPPMGPAGYVGYPQAFAYPPMAPAYAPPYGYPQPGHAQAQHYPQPVPYWPQNGGPVYPQPYPQPHAAPPPAYDPEAHMRAQQAAAAPEPSPIDEIRASLRECRDAIRELAEQRTQRRYF